MAGEGPPEDTTFYYDPIIDVHHRLPVRSHLFSSWYAAPQVPTDARRLFEAACASAGLYEEPLGAPLEPRGSAIALALSREWGLRDLEDRLLPAIEAQFEPTWDRTRGEFTWGLGLREEHPRGQYNAFLAAAEVGSTGAWTRLSEAPLPECPQLVGVDFPEIALRTARWEDEALHLVLDVQHPDPRNTTSFRLEGVAPERRFEIDRDGSSVPATLAQSAEGWLVRTARNSGTLRIVPKD